MLGFVLQSGLHVSDKSELKFISYKQFSNSSTFAPPPPFKNRSGDGDGNADALVTPAVADDVKSVPARADSSVALETDNASLSAVSALVTAI